MTIQVVPGSSLWKLRVLRFTIFLFGRAAQVLSRIDPEIRSEISRWPEGFRILYKVLPDGPRMALVRTGPGLECRRGNAAGADADLILAVKNVQSAFLVFTFRIGMHQAYAQNRVSVRGDVPIAMSQMRVLNRVLAYLLPERVARRVTVRMPEIPPVRKHVSRWVVYLLGVPSGLRALTLSGKA